MQQGEFEQAPANAQRGKGRRKAALHLLLLLGVPCLVLSSVFLTGAYWGSSRVPKWFLEKEASWFGWSASPAQMQAAQRIANRRNGLGMALSAVTSSPTSKPTTKPTTKLTPKLGGPAKSPPIAPVPAPSKPEPAAAAPAQPEPTQPAKIQPAQGPEDSTAASKKAPAASAKAPQDPTGQKNHEPTGPDHSGLPSLAGPPTAAAPAQKRLQTAKDRFDLPAKVGVMLVVDAQAFPGTDSCGRARSALHAANIKFRAWLNLSLDVRGCLPWVAKSDQKKARGNALAALDLPGTDLLLVLTRPGSIELPALGVERDVFNAGLSLAPVPGGADDAGVSRALMHALGLAMGAEPITNAQSPDAKRGSVMNAQAQARRDWLDEPNRWRMLERKQWPFARRNRALGGR